MKQVVDELFSMQDLKYKEFHAKLMPTIEPERIIGVRTPMMRSYAKKFAKSDDVESFLKELPHYYYEENNLHGFVIETIKDFDECMQAVEHFLPYVDNWATCDLMRPKVFQKHTDELFPYIKKWMASGEPYTIRFGIEMLMCYYLDDAFLPEHLQMVAEITSDHYYVKMMVAWYVATALAKQYDSTILLYESGKLEKWIHNKAIQKAIESYRISEETKDYLRTLRKK